MSGIGAKRTPATPAKVAGTGSRDCGLKRDDGGGFVEGGAVHLGGDGVAREEFGADGWYELRAGWSGQQPFLLAAEREDDGHAVVDVAHGVVGLRREDGEVHRVLFGRLKGRWFAGVDACHRERLAG